jgi:mRNA-degrading endonuclease YafQ of YafQ-DinJ toxin-antitoxin module
MQILQSSQFKRAYKKLHSNQFVEINEAVKKIIADPNIGEKKQGDLSWLRVYKFKTLGQLILIGYYTDNETLTFAALGPHENFYRDIKK